MYFYSNGKVFSMGYIYQGDEMDMIIGDRKATAEEIASYQKNKTIAVDNIKAKELRATAMLEGVDYNGFQISFTKDDGDGLVQVKAAFELGLTATTIHFANGTKMPITAAEFGAFALWFVNKRNEFFV